VVGVKMEKSVIDLFLSDEVGAFEKDKYLGSQVEGEKLSKLAKR
jgi:hypothetical protein